MREEARRFGTFLHKGSVLVQELTEGLFWYMTGVSFWYMTEVPFWYRICTEGEIWNMVRDCVVTLKGKKVCY